MLSEAGEPVSGVVWRAAPPSEGMRETEGEPKGQLWGVRRNVERRPSGRPPAAAFNPIAGAHCSCVGQERVWSLDSQI